jgi:hypothetical protein
MGIVSLQAAPAAGVVPAASGQQQHDEHDEQDGQHGDCVPRVGFVETEGLTSRGVAVTGEASSILRMCC